MKIQYISKIITWLMGFIVSAGVIIYPLGFYLISYYHEIGSIEIEAGIKAGLVTQIISANPQLWEFEQVRINGILRGRSEKTPNEIQRVFNSKNELIAGNTLALRFPLIIRSSPIFDSGENVGRVEVLRSLYPIVRRSGLILSIVLPIGLGVLLILCFLPIKKIRETEQALIKSEERYSQAANVAHMGHWERRIENESIFWSRETYKIFGVDPGQFEPTMESFISCIHPEDRKSQQQALQTIMTNKGKYDTEYRIIRPDGDIRVIHSIGQVILNKKEEIKQIIGIAHDVTERRNMEEKLQWAAQMNIIAQLTKGLTEDIMNSLAGIKASLEVLSQNHTFSEDEMNIMSKAMNEIGRAKQTIKSFTSFTNPPRPERISVNMNYILDMIIGFSLKQPHYHSAKITFIKDFDQGIPDIKVDPFQMQQIFLNLIFNAFDAMPEGGTITVTTAYESDVDYIRIMISDTGRGIDKTVKDNIFQPFYSTKPKGTGLGLPISKRFIEQHRGEICVSSNKERGTTFYVTFPVNQSESV